MPKTEPISPDFHDKVVYVAVRIGYPGSRVTDVIFGNHILQLPNDALMAAGKLYMELEDEGGTDTISTYDARADTVALFGGDGEFDQ